MEATREIYWNIGHVSIGFMYILAFIAMGLCVWGFYLRLPVYRIGKALNRLDQFARRVGIYLADTFGQVRVFSVRVPGTLHAVFFWGFLLLFIGTLLVMIQADFTDPLFSVRFLRGTFYKIFKVTLNSAGCASIVALLGLAVRRFIVKPEGLVTSGEDYLSHVLLLVILVTGFVLEGARMAVTELHVTPQFTRFSFGGLPAAWLLDGMSVGDILTFHKSLWWFHFLLAMVFIACIPFTKLRHLFTTSTDYLFTDLRPKGAIETIDLEDENRERFGAAQLTDLAWKDIFDADACTICKRCQDRCPAWATGKPLSPMKVIRQIEEVAFGAPEANLVDTVTRDVLWACTTCRACQEICPSNIEHVNKILEMRRHLALMDGEFPGDEVKTAINHYEVNGNPFGIGFAERGGWSEGLDLPILSEGGKADILYFVGCYASFDKRNQAVARAFVEICKAAGVRIGILGKEETCCGEPARKLGNEYLYQMLARRNIEIFNRYGVRRIVTTCPHCFNTLERDYRDLGFEGDVEDYTTFIDRLIKQGWLSLVAERFDCTYHDACYLGRYKELYSPPRDILSCAGARVTEMEKSGAESFCCGAGGGRILAEERIGRRISETRIAMAQDIGARLMISNCPFCLTMFEDGIKTGGFEGKMQVQDLAEIVMQRIVQCP
jgi:Fe-S oxidoreductase/nitrate reductase gamma subunit